MGERIEHTRKRVTRAVEGSADWIADRRVAIGRADGEVVLD